MSFLVARRTQEVGVRIAPGATPAQVSVLLLMVAVAAALAPSLKAARTNPVAELRWE
jgi:ABC-type antimicrobial peptide transport system permease subunit